jgi:hypothetical protein
MKTLKLLSVAMLVVGCLTPSKNTLSDKWICQATTQWDYRNCNKNKSGKVIPGFLVQELAFCHDQVNVKTDELTHQCFPTIEECIRHVNSPYTRNNTQNYVNSSQCTINTPNQVNVGDILDSTF